VPTRATLIAAVAALTAIAALLVPAAARGVPQAPSPAASAALALEWNGLRPSSVEARSARDSLVLAPDERSVYRSSGTWHEMFDPDGLTNRFPVLFWVAALVVVGVIGLPYVWLAAAALPDRGFAFARPVGLLLVAWLVWWLASVEVATFSRTTVALVAVVLAAGAAAIVVGRRRQFAAWVRERWRVLAVEEAIFWSMFAAVLLVRWLNPDLWHPFLGGEKPMDFAFLNAVLKSAYFPPFDPWFAGGYINYYYYGFVLVAVLVKATAIVPYVAYNLAIPTLAAFLAAGAAGVALALSSRRPGRVPGRALAVAGLAAVFVGVVGNLSEIAVIADKVSGWWRHEWWYWNATRTISVPSTEPGPVTEFPWFTYLYADLHAHAMALPYTAVALGLGLAYVRGEPGGGRVAAALRFGLLALVLGALWPMNTWDVPTYAFLALVALVLGWWGMRGRSEPRSLLRPVALGVGLVATAYLLFLPFHEHYLSAFTGLERWRGTRTAMVDYLEIHGFFLFLIVTALAADFWLARDLGPVPRLLRLLLRKRRPRRLLRLHRSLVSVSPAYAAGVAGALLGLVVALGLAVVGEGVPALIVTLLTFTALLFVRRPGEAPPALPLLARRLRQMTLVLVGTGLAITLAVEYLVIRRIDIGRSASVFKTYNQVWLLWAVAAAVSVGVVYEYFRRLRRPWRAAWVSGFALLFAGSLLYPALATPAKIDDRFDQSVGPTLNGMAFMRKAIHVDRKPMRLVYDLEAIRWLQEHVEGSPVVAEVNTDPTLYGWGNRYAMFTGNPAVVGWGFHESQQRSIASETAIPNRIADVQRLYRTRDPDEAYRLLRRYGVEYVVVGSLERVYFPRGQRKWASREGSLWDLVYRNSGTAIYRVRPPSPSYVAHRGRPPSRGTRDGGG
jgi:YYY domain-containing protein